MHSKINVIHTLGTWDILVGYWRSTFLQGTRLTSSVLDDRSAKDLFTPIWHMPLAFTCRVARLRYHHTRHFTYNL